MRPAAATTGRDGRFRIDEVPRDGIATASITGPGIETTEIYILTRDVPTIRVKRPDIADAPMLVYYGARFDHVAVPSRPIVGTIREKDTGAPIAGMRITGMPNIPNSLIPTPGVEATSDAQGRYRVNGLPTSRGFKLFTEAAAGQPYVNHGFVSAANEPKPGPLTFDITLKRGVLVRGRLTDKATGGPVRGSVSYHAFADNPHLNEYRISGQWSQENAGSSSQVSRRPIRHSHLPAGGRSLIAARAQEERYLHGIGAEAIKGFDKQAGAFSTYPFYCATARPSTFLLRSTPQRARTRSLSICWSIPAGRSRAPLFALTINPVDDESRDPHARRFPKSRANCPRTPRFVRLSPVLPSGRYRLDFIHHQA